MQEGKPGPPYTPLPPRSRIAAQCKCGRHIDVISLTGGIPEGTRVWIEVEPASNEMETR
jgi:hypothetical protein